MMKSGFHFCVLKPKSSEAVDAHIDQTSRKSLNKRYLQEIWWQLYSETGNECWWWNVCNKSHNNIRRSLWNIK
jgi:hypothetical protein